MGESLFFEGKQRDDGEGKRKRHQPDYTKLKAFDSGRRVLIFKKQCCSQKKYGNNYPGVDEEPEPSFRAHNQPPTAPASLKIGRYMATTRPPTVVPRNTINKGSIMAVMAPTASSTSSS